MDDALAYLVPWQGKLTLEFILDVAADYFGFTVSQLISRDRSAKIALARQIVMFVDARRDRRIAAADWSGAGRSATTPPWATAVIRSPVN